MSSSQSKRIEALDYLRGFFIVVIIVDHVFRFPNIFALFSGEARLWMTAAEGFILISGLLIGYIRGRKGMKLPFSNIAQILFKRAVVLYVWLVLGSLIYLGIASWILAIPDTPSATVTFGDWFGLIWNIITMQHPAVWVHFLYLYAIYLVLSIGAVWLLRSQRSLALVTISIGVYLIGWLCNVEWMKWQLLFFGAATAGFYLDTIRRWWSEYRHKLAILIGIYSLTIVTLICSITFVFLPQLVSTNLVSATNSLFSIDTFGPARVIISILWFTALCLIFNQVYPFLKRYTFGLLEYFGTHSLTAYITHGVVICLFNAFIPRTSSYVTNSVVVFAAILLVYGFIKIPLVQKVVPR